VCVCVCIEYVPMFHPPGFTIYILSSITWGVLQEEVMVGVCVWVGWVNSGGGSTRRESTSKITRLTGFHIYGLCSHNFRVTVWSHVVMGC
jgi:hypothetical protein